MMNIGNRSNTWRDYQRALKKEARRKILLRKMPGLILWAVAHFLGLAAVIGYATGSWIFSDLDWGSPPESPEDNRVEQPDQDRLIRADLPGLLSELKPRLYPIAETYALENQAVGLNVRTSVDASLQQYIMQLLKRSRTHQAAVVALRPDNGQILAMAHYENPGDVGQDGLCLRADFPAASLFKIVAAAAVIEARGLDPDAVFYFRGKRHTLYQSQLKQEKGRWAVKTTLKKAFSGSINPVFGKIGIYHLGKSVMDQYADRFLFNHPIPFDLPLGMSRIEVPKDRFGLAEIASGFNKRTLISPLHAALITAAIANKGVMMEPWIVKTVEDETGKVLYRARPSELATPIKASSAEILKVLMRDTVVAGTCRSAFRPLRQKKAFKDISFGAKTGTINDAQDQYKYDWLTAYALPAKGGGGISLVVLAVHGEKLGIRAKEMATRILRHYLDS